MCQIVLGSGAKLRTGLHVAPPSALPYPLGLRIWIGSASGHKVLVTNCPDQPGMLHLGRAALGKVRDPPGPESSFQQWPTSCNWKQHKQSTKATASAHVLNTAYIELECF